MEMLIVIIIIIIHSVINDFIDIAIIVDTIVPIHPLHLHLLLLSNNNPP